jgi:hypothetical protein
MTTVTVDLADLEALVFSTGAMKSIEGILATRKNDPFVRPHLDITAAHQRLAAEMRNAKRAAAGTAVAWDEPATTAEQAWLARFEENPVIHVSAERRNPSTDRYDPAVDRLAAKGMLVIGQVVSGVLWAGEERPELVPDTTIYALKITARGMAERGRMKAAKAREATS